MSLFTTDTKRGCLVSTIGIIGIVIGATLLFSNEAHCQKIKDVTTAVTVDVKNLKFSSEFLVYAQGTVGDSCVIHVFRYETQCFRCDVDEVTIPKEWDVIETRKGKFFLKPKYKPEL